MSTTVSTQDVAHLAQLSGLALTDDEQIGLRDDIAAILGYIEQLAELDTTGVEPTYQVTGLTNVWREDRVAAGPATAEQLVSLAPNHDQQTITVPKVL